MTVRRKKCRTRQTKWFPAFARPLHGYNVNGRYQISGARLRRFKDLFSIFLRDLTMPCYFYATVGIILRREALNISTKE